MGVLLIPNQYDRLEDGLYYVKIDTELFDGVLNYGELVVEGEVAEEVFIRPTSVIPLWLIMSYRDQR